MNVSASYESLFNQAKMTVEDYFDFSCRLLEDKFGKHYPSDHPELVGRLVSAMSVDLATSVTARLASDAYSSLN